MLDACTACIPSEHIEQQVDPSVPAHWQKLRGTASPSHKGLEDDCVVALVKQEMAGFMRRLEVHFSQQESLMRAVVKNHNSNNLMESSADNRALISLDGSHMFHDCPVDDTGLTEKRHAEDHILIQKARKAGEADLIRMTSLRDDVSYDASFRERLKHLIGSLKFEIVASLLILTNVVFLGVEVEITAWIPLNEAPSIFLYANSVFTWLYTFEVSLKLFAFHCEFFTNGDRAWNVFDLIIVICSLGDFAMTMILAAESHMVSMTQMRMLRVIRGARILRAVRMAKVMIMFSSLRALILSISDTLRSMAWTAVLLVVIFYGFGVCFTQAVSDHCRSVQVYATGDPNAMPVCTDKAMVVYWGSLANSMYTLFKSISGGISWHDCVGSLADASEMAHALFIVYISLGYFVILNVVTGIFCNSAIECARLDKEVAIAHQLKQKGAFVRSLRKCFRDLDHDNSNVITFEEFEKALACERMSSMMDSMEIDTSDIWGLFRLIDSDQNGVIDVEELVDGCLRYKGAARATHVAKLMYDGRMQRKQITRIEQMIIKVVHALNLNLCSS
eukprot:TRINITY_DN26604_c0_g1_i2.p1 TRINITY_DN26604_c0_g1~~TRINITY_DN26604_c0_g1_i2.p1  ORF type:complete len:591 (+),score=74.15 TRINITY_DN26604_c0_g1_i2:94-1773(+)